jgi:hypothetical protein
MQDKDKNISDEQLKKVFEETTKKIDVGTIDESEKVDIKAIVASIQEVIDEIEQKKADFLEKKKTNADKLDALRKTGKVKVDEEKIKRTEKAAEFYVTFIENVLKELQIDYDFFSDLLSDNPAKQVRVFKDSPDDFHTHLKVKINNTKRNLKKMRKDFRVYFSRYTYDFYMQEKYLDYLANYLKILEQKKTRQHAETQNVQKDKT